MRDLVPWEIHPDLELERLRIVATLIAEVRRKALLRHEPSEGDGAWSLGCVAYQRTMFLLERGSQEYTWLRIVERRGLYFVFSIGAVPIRFYRGDHDNHVEERRLVRHYLELRQHQEAFFFAPPPEMDRILRLAIETGDSGQVSNVVLVQVDSDGNTHNPFFIPLADAAAIRLFAEARKEGIQLSPPSVGEAKPAEPAAESGASEVRIDEEH
jgi:hypothetical protein